MDRMIPVPVQNIVDEYMALFHERIPNRLEGFYLHGSIALNAFIEGTSDIDFIAIVNQPLTDTEVKLCLNIHQELKAKYSSTEMDGTFLLHEDMGKKQSESEKYLYINECKAAWVSHTSYPITWWILKSKGISVFGPAIDSFHFEIDESVLVDYVLMNMNSYWGNRIKTIKRYKRIANLIPAHVVDTEIEWSITGMLRQYYTLREHDILSKMEACNYALSYLPSELHNIVNEAIRIREGQSNCPYPSKKQQLEETVQCMTYILDYCNNTFSKKATTRQ